ncbi:ankyrin repeat domain-containing protein [Tahibacter soli]|uniref:Ankyrin repeat domain-containing protein n=1 Tax=Tahibacter soli TaxID=2983605 RepID=A0A9X3YQU3_9GAMM|nr:ankyrin repeat domain-containing protein [Tahibacter soli]MDC8015850.1 ankyrin repeat domain-containing protein [Tahibacter soli]
MKIFSVLGVLALAASAASCSKGGDQTTSPAAVSEASKATADKEKPDEGRSTIEQFYAHRAKGDYAAAYEMMIPAYKALRGKESWIAAMKEFEAAAGGFKRADIQSWSPENGIMVEYGNLTAHELLWVSLSAPYRITGLAIMEPEATAGSQGKQASESRGERITDPATEMTFNGVAESIANNHPKDLLNRIEFERRMGNRTPWHLLAGPRQMTLLHFAALQGATDSASELIGLGTPVDVLAEHDSTPLFLAACAGRLETVKLLVSRGADVARPNDLALKPQDCAKAQGKLDVASWLEAQSAGIAKSPFEPLRRLDAIAKAKYDKLCADASEAMRSTPNHPQTVSLMKQLIDEGLFTPASSCFVIEEGPPDTALHQMNATIRGERGRGKINGNALAIAAAVGSIEVVRHAVEHGFDPGTGVYAYTNMQGRRGIGPAILLAAQNGHGEVVRLLIEKGADVNGIDTGSMRQIIDYAEDPAIRRMLLDAAAGKKE